ncbi:MAG: TonB-dependent receptor [Siphonobacter sp.]
MKPYLLSVLFLCFILLNASLGFAQDGGIKGRVVHDTTKAVVQAKLVLTQAADSTKRLTSQTDTAGHFIIKGLEQGPTFRLKITKEGFQSREINVSPVKGTADIGTIAIAPTPQRIAAAPSTAVVPVNTPVSGNEKSAQTIQQPLNSTTRRDTIPAPGRSQTQQPVSGLGSEVKGKVADKADGSALFGVTVQLFDRADSTKRLGTTTDADGAFSFHNVDQGTYTLRISNIGYTAEQIQLRTYQPVMDLGKIQVSSNAKNLKEVTVKGTQDRVEQKSDTLIYNADAYKVTKDANVEDLVTKMPGITISNGTVQAQGQDVKRVLVDGREFFGDDATLALRNLPAEVVDKIQVFDRLSDQAQFTGFDDGNSERTINITTKSGRNNGQFGKVYAGYGTDDRYSAGGSINFFNGKRRISVIGQSNNINQQNFAMQDLLGALGTSSSSSRGGGGARGSGGNFGGGGAASNFIVGQQGGITSTNALGLNYTDNWGKKIKITGSYFFNKANNNTETVLTRNYFTSTSSGQTYNQDSETSNRNNNHRVSLRFEYAINPKTSLIITPRLSFQENNAHSLVSGVNSQEEENVLLSQTRTENTSYSHGFTINNNILLRHQFAKQGRTIAFGVGTALNQNDKNNLLQSRNEYYSDTDSTALINQKSVTNTNSDNWSVNINYTEPLSKSSQLQFSYNGSLTNSNSNKETRDYVDSTGSYSSLNQILSNKFKNQYITHQGGLAYRLRSKQSFFTLGLNYQMADLTGNQLFPKTLSIQKTFSNLLPNVDVNYRFTSTKNLRFNYRTATTPPSITQLQNVYDNSNPLFISSGNPDLKQEYTHTISLRYNSTNLTKSVNFFGGLFATFTMDNITNSTFIATNDTTLIQGVLLSKGSQYSRPVNLSGTQSIRAFSNLGLPLKSLKSNLNLNGGITYSRTPGLINEVKSFTNNLAMNAGAVLSSNISERMDFSVAYNGAYTIIRYTIQPSQNSNYFSHTARIRMNWISVKGFVISPDVTNTLYSGLGAGYDRNFTLFNLGIGQKLFKEQRGELRLTVFDLLNQNNSISRTSTETYLEDSRTTVLKRYFMLTFTYNVRNFRNVARK